MPDEAKPGSTEHHIRAQPIHFLLVGVFLLALVTALGGAVAIIMGFVSPTEFEMFGARLSTIHVGGALVAVGFITAVFTVRSVQRSVTELLALPPDEKAKRQKK
jgi:hypothetical protein